MGGSSFRQGMLGCAGCLLLIGLLAAGGCRSQAPPAAETPALQAERPAAQAPSTGRKRIAVVPKALSGEYWVRCEEGARQAAEELDVELTFNGPPTEVDVDKQIEIVENLLSSGVDGIAISPCDGEALAPVIDQAVAAGVPVVTIDSDANTDQRLSYIGTDNQLAGATAAEQMVELLGEQGGKIGIINGVPGAQNLMERIKGFKQVLELHPQIKIVSEQACQSDQAMALSITENMLTSDPELAGIFGVNAPGGPGAAEAVRNAGKTGQVVIVAFDVLPDTLRYCADGVIQAIIEQRPERMGDLGVRRLVEALDGISPLPREDTGVDVITPEQAKEMVEG